MMINTTSLQRLDRRSIENKANRFTLVVWILLWAAMGTTVKVLWDEWYGLAAGLFIGVLIALGLTWLFFGRQGAKEKQIVAASWAENSFRIYDPILDRTTSIDLSHPHRAILIRSKSERRFLLRLEQIAPDKNNSTRINLIGPLPVPLPMPPSGDARSLMGFFKMATSKEMKSIPYQIKASDTEGNDTAKSLLEFVEQHKQYRDNRLHVRRGNDTIQVLNGIFTLITPDKNITFDENKDVSVWSVAKSYSSDKVNAAEISIGLIPEGRPEDALVFSIIAPEDRKEDFAQSWELPKAATNRKFLLYDDSAQSYVVTNALKRYVKQYAPNNPILEILRH